MANRLHDYGIRAPFGFLVSRWKDYQLLRDTNSYPISDERFQAMIAMVMANVQGEPEVVPFLEEIILRKKSIGIFSPQACANWLRMNESAEALAAIERLIEQEEARGVVKELASALAWRGDEDSLELLERLCADQRFSDDERFQLKNARDILTGRLR